MKAKVATALALILVVPSLVTLGNAAAPPGATNVIVPASETTFPYAGSQGGNWTDFNDANPGGGGLILEPCGTGPCGARRHSTTGYPYDPSNATYDLLFNMWAPVTDPTTLLCDGVDKGRSGRPSSYLQFNLTEPRVVNHVFLNFTGMAGLSDYSRMCIGVTVRGASNGTWWTVAQVRGFPNGPRGGLDASFDPATIDAARLSVQWFHLGPCSPAPCYGSGWAGAYVYDFALFRVGVPDAFTLTGNVADGQNVLTWTTPLGSPTSYRVTRHDNHTGAATTIDVGTATTFTEPSTTWKQTYVVRACNAAGCSLSNYVILRLPQPTSDARVNVVVPTTESAFAVIAGEQTGNQTTLANPASLGSGGLICDTSRGGGSLGCVDTRHTAGAEYDQDTSTYTTYFNQWGSVTNATTLDCTGLEYGSGGRPPSYVQYNLSSPQAANRVFLNFTRMPGLSDYHRMCIGVVVRGAGNGTWWTVGQVRGFPTDASPRIIDASFDQATIDAVRLAVQWFHLGPCSPAPCYGGGWTGARVHELQVYRVGPPDAPRALEAEQGDQQVTLTWGTPKSWAGSPITAYRVYRATTSGAAGTLLASGGCGGLGVVLTCTDATVTVGQTYFYTVTAVNALGEGARSNEAASTAATTPSAPVLQAAAGPAAGEVNLTWTVPPDGSSPITGYRVYRGTASGSEALVTTGACSAPTAPACVDAGLGNNVTRYYRVSAVNALGEGPRSAEASATTFGPPGAPQGLAAATHTGGVSLSWSAPVPDPARDGGFPLAWYSLYRGASSGAETFLTRVNASSTTYLDPACGLGTEYHYVVTASTELGEGPASPGASAASGNAAGTGNDACEDAYDPSKYQPESPTGNTPFGGATLKPTFPGQATSPSVNLANGELVATFQLLRVSEPLSHDFTFDLTYRSMGNPDGAPGLPNRWAATWLERMEADGADLAYRTGDGRVLRFTNATDGWYGPPGTYAKVTSPPGKLQMRDRYGNLRDFDPAHGGRLTDAYDASGNRWALAYAADGKLSTVTDPLGRAMTLGYSGTGLATVTDFAGRVATLQRDALGRITGISTPGPTAGTWATTQLGYDASGHLASVTDPKGQTYLTLQADPFGRTTMQRASTGATTSFHYNHTSGVTQVWDGEGNRVEWRFKPQGATAPRVVPVSRTEHTRGLRASDPAAFVTTFTHNAQDEVTSVTHPAGNGVTNAYDEASPSFFARGNLLSQTRTPGPVQASPLQTTSQASITTLYTYDAACNKPATIVDPRGTDPAYAPPNGGAASAARYTTSITYDAACRPIAIQRPTVNPAGAPHSAFTPAYAAQAMTETFTYNAAGQLLTRTDAAGVVETRAYHPAPSTPGKPAGYLESLTRDPGAAPRLDLRTTFEYNALGAVTRTTDPNGNVRTFDVDARGRTTQETSPTNVRTRWTFDANDDVTRVERETNPGSGAFATRDYAYDALGRLASETSRPSATHAITTAYAYDMNGNLARRTGGAGGVTTWTYDERNLVLAMSGPDGGAWAYDANGNLRTRTDPLGRATTYRHDGYDRLAVGTNAQGTRSITSYDPAGNVVSEEGAGGTSGLLLHFRTFAHDEANRQYERREWLANASTATRATLGTAAGRWVTTLAEHDALGRPTRVIDDNGRATVTTYDNASRPATVTDPMGNVVRNAYDDNGNLLARTRLVAGHSTTTCPEVCTTTYAYDGEDRPVTVTNPDGTTRTTAYDGRGNVVQATDETGLVTLNAYDEADRLLTVRRLVGLGPTYVTTTTTWDDEDRVQSQCDDTGNCTTYTYVPATSLVASQTPPPVAGPSVARTHDAAGNVVTLAYSSGKRVHLAYDSLDRLVNVSVTGVPAFRGTLRQTFTYDDAGRVTAATDDGLGNLGAGVVTSLTQVPLTQSFDTLGRVVAESQAGFPVTHTLDGVGNVLSTRYPSTDGRTVLRAYDANERLSRVWDAKGHIASYAYLGELVKEKSFGGPTPTPAATGPATPVLRTLTTYDGMARPGLVRHENGTGTLLAGLTTRFDAAGNRVAQKLASDAGATDAHSQLFDLDPLHRLAAWARGPLTSSSPATPLDTIASPVQHAAWTNDGANNWQTWSAGAGTCTRATGAAGTPAVRYVADACPASSQNHTFDADGNLVRDGTYAYRWDFLNRLIRVDDAAGNLVVGYGYDAFGRRVIKTFPDNVVTLSGTQGTKEGIYTFAGHHVIQESQPIGSILPQTVPPTPSTVHVLRQWTYGPAVDEVLDMDVDAANTGTTTIGPGSQRYFYAHDSAGNVLGLAGETGRLLEGYAYEPYGNVTILVPATGSPHVKWDGTDVVSVGTFGTGGPRPYSESGNLWFFTGRQYDPEIGAYNYRAREYSPTLGQFMSADPIGAWGDPTNLGNPYAYVGNNPSSYADPSGLAWWNPLDGDFVAWELGGNTVAVAAGTLGATGGGVAGLAMHQDLSGFSAGWDAGAAFSPLGSVGSSARERVRGTYESFDANADAPAWAKAGAYAFGPPQTQSDATLALALAVIPGGPGGKATAASASLADDAFRLGAGAGRGARAARVADDAAEAGAAARQVDFVVTPKGDAIPIPQGAKGPAPARNGKGFTFLGGEGGGNGLHPRVDGVRVMDPTPPRAPSPGYPNGYVVYMKGNQAVDPYTGKMLAKHDKWWHIELR